MLDMSKRGSIPVHHRVIHCPEESGSHRKPTRRSLDLDYRVRQRLGRSRRCLSEISFGTTYWTPDAFLLRESSVVVVSFGKEVTHP